MIPIYGIAAVFIIIAADMVGYNLWKVFLIGSFISTIIEYFSSWIQEKIFHTKSWDYSNMPFQLHGRVNLLYSIAFGCYAVLFIKQIKWLVQYIQIQMDTTLIVLFTLIIFVLFLLDVFISVTANYRQKQRREGVVARNWFEQYLDKKYNDEVLNQIYNNSVYIDSHKVLKNKV